MYSFGMCCLLAFVPNAPATVDPFTLVHKIPTSIKRLEPELHSLLEVTLCQDPKRRATASELLEHEFFKVDAVVHELEERKRKVEEDAKVIARKCAEGRRHCSSCYVEKTKGETKEQAVDPAVAAAVDFLKNDPNDKRCRKHLVDTLKMKPGKTYVNKKLFLVLVTVHIFSRVIFLIEYFRLSHCFSKSI